MYVDETTYVLLAQSLSSGHLATQTSFTSVYTSAGAMISSVGGHVIVEPWFDHLPFFAILDVPFFLLGDPRLLPVILGALTTFLIMYLLRNNPLEAILAGAIFAVFPFAIQLNAMTFLDNGAIFFLLLTIALTSMYEEKGRESILIFAAISAGLSFLSKEMGIFAVLYFLLYIGFSRSFKKNFKWLILSIGVASSWFIYGLLLDRGLFLTIFTTQFGRTNAASSLGQIFATAASNFTYNYDNFYVGSLSPILLLSWIAVVIFAFGKGHRQIKLGLLSFIITLAVFRYAWFYTWISIYPFFAMALAFCVYGIFSFAKNNWRRFNK